MHTFSFQVNLVTSVLPLICGIVAHSEGFEIMIRSPVLGQDCVENRVSCIFELRVDTIEFIVVLDFR